MIAACDEARGRALGYLLRKQGCAGMARAACDRTTG
jgi:hypothetical protein